MLWEIIAVGAFIILMVLGKIRKTSLFGPFIIGIIIGIWWEITAETDFNYTGFSIYIWKDVPLAIIVLWGITIAGYILISDFFQEKIPIFKKGKKSELKNCLFWDVSIASLFGVSMELLGSKLFSMWTYPSTSEITLYNLPIRWLVGWVYVGLFNLAFIRRYGDFFEIKWMKRKIEQPKK